MESHHSPSLYKLGHYGDRVLSLSIHGYLNFFLTHLWCGELKASFIGGFFGESFYAKEEHINGHFESPFLKIVAFGSMSQSMASSE